MEKLIKLNESISGFIEEVREAYEIEIPITFFERILLRSQQGKESKGIRITINKVEVKVTESRIDENFIRIRVLDRRKDPIHFVLIIAGLFVSVMIGVRLLEIFPVYRNSSLFIAAIPVCLFGWYLVRIAK